ncbi:hypothetical protein C8R43DRAFT_1133481 [Mycena crocata]|nr:hypothetical protein C8R43DRAFT_1133481 [Mycena crocata]
MATASPSREGLAVFPSAPTPVIEEEGLEMETQAGEWREYDAPEEPQAGEETPLPVTETINNLLTRSPQMRERQERELAPIYTEQHPDFDKAA